MFCAGVFFSLPKPSFAYISISDEIERVMKDELPEARFVAADNIVDSSWKGERIDSRAVKISSSWRPPSGSLS